LRSGAPKPPLFCLQGVLLYQTVAQHVETDRPIYGVYLPEEVELLKTGKYDPVNSVFSSIPRIASRYLQSIRSVQPHGPYYLAGSSFAGLIAFEMAQQLRAAGEEVALVAMFDSWMITKLPLQRRLRGHRDLFLKHGFSYLLDKVHHRTKGIRRKIGLTPVYEQIGQGDRVADGPSRVSAEVQHDILDEVNARAARSYQPLPYPGRFVLFRATEQAFFSEHLPDLGWQSFAAGEFEVIDVPGSHLAILQQPGVSVLVQRLRTYLG
jgi:thioesterase domain-containing protein